MRGPHVCALATYLPFTAPQKQKEIPKKECESTLNRGGNRTHDLEEVQQRSQQSHHGIACIERTLTMVQYFRVVCATDLMGTLVFWHYKYKRNSIL